VVRAGRPREPPARYDSVVRAVLPTSVLHPVLGELPDPVPGPGEVLVEVAAAGLNHADLLQLQGHYPPPPGESAVPGLEAAGRITALGEQVAGTWREGDRVMALLGGGGLATRAAIPAGQLMAVPGNLSWSEAAALPEAGLTAWTNLVAEGGLREGETVLVTGATGGMGTMFVQLAQALGARVIAAGRSLERLETLRDLGASDLVRLDADLPARVRELTGGRGVDLVADLVGGPDLGRRVAALAPRGRLILLGLLAGDRAELDLGPILSRRLRLVGSVLRSRPRAEKAELVAGFAAFALPRLAEGRLRPVVDRVLPFERAGEAFAALRRGGAAGKIVLEMAGT
jgi:putative PIG3 family NAD(P)H quinone oxidoreductase